MLKCRKYRGDLLLAVLIIVPIWSAGQVVVNSDQWALTDALGRKVIDSDSLGGKKSNKFVGMFYWTWHQMGNDTTYQVKNITNILRDNPKAINDYNHPAWGDKKPGLFYWEEPLLGYYRTTDPWVLRKHAEMLADAGLDVVFLDCTNAKQTWEESYNVLFETWSQAKKDGVNVPKIAFMLHFFNHPPYSTQNVESLRKLYLAIYKAEKHKDLWFYWRGKPCIMAYPDSLGDSGIDKEIANFFTFRPTQPDYVDGPKRIDQWSWLENYPQNGYGKTLDGRIEQVSVGVAQNAGPLTDGHCSAFNLPGTYGRHFSKEKGFDPRIDGYLYGWNFQEQWDRAFELDPELVFVTGWNEYIAGQWLPEHGWTGDPFSFVDQYDWQHSRDIEPNKGWGEKGDVYYHQLIDNVRRFKGMDVMLEISGPKRIKLGKAGVWDDVLPYYAHYKGNTFERNHRGVYNAYYMNNTGRNDIVGAKVTRDDDKIYFYVETADKLTSSNDRNWMMLFIDIDRNKETGWNGYDYIINRQSPHRNQVIIEKNVGNRWEWSSVGTAPMKIRHNVLEIAAAKDLFGITESRLNFEFKWNDNMQDIGNIMDFYVNGDTAPGGRFNFVYKID